jgi:hypothetical protein
MASDLEMKEAEDDYDRLREQVAWWEEQYRLQTKEIERLRKALEDVAEGKGRFANSPFEHACNTIEDMKQIARDALAKAAGDSGTQAGGDGQ